MTRVVYWDASAVLSAIVKDRFTGEALREIRNGSTIHLASSLALAEAHAVIARMVREGIIGRDAGRRARQAMADGPWRMTWCHPDTGLLARLASRHPLRGADLWHLATALRLAGWLPGLVLLAFDDRLRSAALAEGLWK